MRYTPTRCLLRDYQLRPGCTNIARPICRNVSLNVRCVGVHDFCVLVLVARHTSKILEVQEGGLTAAPFSMYEARKVGANMDLLQVGLEINYLYPIRRDEHNYLWELQYTSPIGSRCIGDLRVDAANHGHIDPPQANQRLLILLLEV